MEKKLTDVELYNWQTGASCQLPDIAVGTCSHSAAVVDGVPIFCGGNVVSQIGITDECFQWNQNSLSWVKVATLSNF